MQNDWRTATNVITLSYIFQILHDRIETPNFLFKQVEDHLSLFKKTENLDLLKRIVY